MASTADIKAAQEKVGEAALNLVRSPNSPSSGEEPPSGFTGRGEPDQPYDQGNQPEVANGPSVEPPSGQQGDGKNEPYDAGNKPEQNSNMSIVDQLSRTKTKTEIQKDKERRLSKVISNQPIPSQSQAQSTQDTQYTQAPPTRVQTEEPRGREQTKPAPTSAPQQNKPPSMKDAPKSTRVIERSVSPGQLDDGRHVKCSGEKGEAYSPPSGFGKIKGKLHIGGS